MTRHHLLLFLWMVILTALCFASIWHFHTTTVTNKEDNHDHDHAPPITRTQTTTTTTSKEADQQQQQQTKTTPPTEKTTTTHYRIKYRKDAGRKANNNNTTSTFPIMTNIQVKGPATNSSNRHKEEHGDVGVRNNGKEKANPPPHRNSRSRTNWQQEQQQHSSPLLIRGQHNNHDHEDSHVHPSTTADNDNMKDSTTPFLKGGATTKTTTTLTNNNNPHNEPHQQQQQQQPPDTTRQQQETTTTKNEGGGSLSEKKEKPMNVVLFYADDWSYETLGSVNSYVQTPVLDKMMADHGMLFTHNCVVSSVCMQSRATLYTGQYSSKHQTFYAWKNVTMYNTWNTTLYPLMMDAGYYVGFYGKYHHLQPWPETIPTFSHHRIYQDRHFLERNGEIRHITEWNEMDGMEFLEQRPRDKPFFLTISFFATHAEDFSQEQYRPMNSSMHWYGREYGPVPKPITYTERHWKDLPNFFDERNFGRGRFMKRYRNDILYQHHMKNTYRMVTEVDAACGRILEKIRNQGELDNTLVIFTTDNGNMHGQHGLAEKWYAYEESLRVPLIIRDPRRMHPTKVGTTNSEFTLNIDLAPTILSAAGIPVPSAMQGRDIAPLYMSSSSSQQDVNWRQEFVYEFWNDNVDIPSSRALVRKDTKYIYWTNQKYRQYFDLLNDPYEQYDLYNRTERNILDELHQRMDNMSAAVREDSTCSIYCFELQVATNKATSSVVATA